MPPTTCFLLFSIFQASGYQQQPVIGNTIQSRFNPPAGYYRVQGQTASFANFLQSLPLKPPGSCVSYYNGQDKQNKVYAAVVNMDIGHQNLQQCADAVIRLKAEFLFASQQKTAISFQLTNGFDVSYTKWQEGYRVMINGNRCSWKKTAAASSSYAVFRAYLDFIFKYAGTISLARQLYAKPVTHIAIGDVFIAAGSPGHAIVVVDLAINKAGRKIFLLAQSYMPAQDIHILKNFGEPALSPWYSIPESQVLETPEWTFTTNQLKTW